MIEKSLALYIHIPYCLEKCPYCDFHSVATEKPLIPEKKYAESLIAQLNLEKERLDFKNRRLVSIFFGGGTPSLMSPEFFAKVLENLGDGAMEITVETNPRTADRNQFKEWLKLGINRISFGTQSFQDSLLKRLGRHHTSADSFRAVREAKEAGFSNINCDLIFGIRDQTLEELDYDLETVLSLDVQHVSAYQLTVEKNTPLWSWMEEGSYRLPEEESLVAMHEKVVRYLEAGGLHRYEISNYAKPGFECRHNLQYWNYGDYLGIGSGAVSKINGRRWRTTKKLKNYLNGDWDYEDVEAIDDKTAWKERWMMGIRLRKGVCLNSREREWEETFAEWQREGFLVQKGGRVNLTQKGFLVTNQLLQNVFDLIDKVC